MLAFCFLSFLLSKMALFWAGDWTRHFDVTSHQDYSMINMCWQLFFSWICCIEDVERSADYLPHKQVFIYSDCSHSRCPSHHYDAHISPANGFCSQFYWAFLFLMWDRVLTLFRPTPSIQVHSFQKYFILSQAFFSAQGKLKLWIQKQE